MALLTAEQFVRQMQPYSYTSPAAGNEDAKFIADMMPYSSGGSLEPGTTNNPSPTSTPTQTLPPPPVLNQAAVDNTQLSINQIPALIQAALAAEATKYGNTIREFDQQKAQQQGQYDESTTTNMLNYDSNMMDSVRAGVRGLGGLMQLLRGTGVEQQAQDIVGTQTSQDIRGGLDTRNENQTQLDNTISGFMTDLERKRRAADDTKVNNERAVTREYNTQLQDLYGKMAGFYSEADRKAEATDWMNKAGSLTPAIAANSMAQVSNYDQAPITVKAPEITAFQAPVEKAINSTASEGQIGSGIFTFGDRRRREQLPVGV